MGDYFLSQASSLQEIVMPSVEEIGEHFLANSALLREVKLGNMIWNGDCFFDEVTSLTYLLEQFRQGLPVDDNLYSCGGNSNNGFSYSKKIV